MNAKQALLDIVTKMEELDGQIRALHEQGSQARDVSGQVSAARLQAATLKQNRRSLLARLFLGEPGADTAELDTQIAQAQEAVDNLQDGEEAAQIALSVLQQQIDAIAVQRQALAEQLPGLRHAVLLESAEEAIRAYQEKAASLGELYAKAAGAILAANENADPTAGRMYAGPLQIERYPVVTTPGGVLRLDLEQAIRNEYAVARQSIPA
jgi:chromosome segregation ATPase